MFSLTRLTDGAGASGDASEALCLLSGASLGVRPQVGAKMRVGETFDRWTTEEVQKILHYTPNKVMFRTVKGSIYTWTQEE